MIRAGLFFILLSVSVAGATTASDSSTITPYQRYLLLKAACQSGDILAVEILLDAGADPNGEKDWEPEAMVSKYSEEFSPPLAAAAETGNTDIVKLLLKRGASVDRLDVEGATPLVRAVAAKQREAAALLLKAGASTQNRLLMDQVRQCEDAGTAELFTLIEGPTEKRLATSEEDPDEAYRDSIVCALETKDWRWIATQISFPVQIDTGKKVVVANTAEDFLHLTEGRFTEELRSQLLRSCKEPLFQNWQGAMVGRGEIWFGRYVNPGDQGPWRYYITAFGGFAYQRSCEVRCREDMQLEPDPEATARERRRPAETARTLALIAGIAPQVLLEQGIYRIQAGDTAEDIVGRFGMTEQDMDALNPQVKWDHLYVGQIILVRRMVRGAAGE